MIIMYEYDKVKYELLLAFILFFMHIFMEL